MPTRTTPSLRTAEVLKRELMEASRKFETLFDELTHTDPLSERAFDLLSELWVQAEVIRSKAEHSKEELNAVMDTLPDE